jgi:membrane-associated phospholipid phosphatase
MRHALSARFVTVVIAAMAAGAPGRGRAGEFEPAAGAASPTPELHPRLTLDLPLHAALTGGLLLVDGASLLLTDQLVAPRCRWCQPDQFDRWARRELRWTAGSVASTASDVLVVALPVGAALTLGLAGRAAGAEAREVGEDLLVVTEAVAVATLLTQASKFGVARLRPDGWAAGQAAGGGGADSRMSFWGGHSALAFTVAGAATEVARLRGRADWRWMALATFTGAAATGFLRVAADRHWVTDVLVGAGVGTAVGLAVPQLVLRPAGEHVPAVTLVPAPGGLAILF